VQGAGCRMQGAGCRVQGPGFRVQGAECIQAFAKDAISFASSRNVTSFAK